MNKANDYVSLLDESIGRRHNLHMPPDLFAQLVMEFVDGPDPFTPKGAKLLNEWFRKQMGK